MTKSKCGILYTIGHSNHTIEDFIGLLKRHKVTAVVDIRSSPYSRYCPQFNKDILAAVLQAANIAYIFSGKELGGRPKDPSCYEGGCASFQRIAESKEFKHGLQRLLYETSKYCIVLMCKEKEPLECHRTILVCRYLKEHNLCIKHILEDGNIEEHPDAERRLVKMLKIEPMLFETRKTETDIVERAYDQQAQRISYQSKEVKETYEQAK